LKHLVTFTTLIFFLLGAGSFLPVAKADTKSPLAGKMLADKKDVKGTSDKAVATKKVKHKKKKGVTKDPCTGKTLKPGESPCGGGPTGSGAGTGPSGPIGGQGAGPAGAVAK
jgi:hypothetical protein